MLITSLLTSAIISPFCKLLSGSSIEITLTPLSWSSIVIPKDSIFRFLSIFEFVFLSVTTSPGNSPNFTSILIFLFFLQTSRIAVEPTSDSATTLATHSGSAVLHQVTDFQDLGRSLGNDNDQSLNGQLYLFDPSNSSHVTHFEAVINEAGASNQSVQRHVSGYVNTTTAITRIRFKADAGTIDSGTIKLYGIK